MSRKKPVQVRIKKIIDTTPEEVFQSKVVRSGNGAVIKAYKKFLGRGCIVIIDQEKQDNIIDSASPEGWKKPKK